MKTTWAVQDAKNRLSEVIDRALTDGPQTITRRGRETAVVVSVDEFRAMTRREGSLVEFFRKSPLCGVDLDLTRQKDTGRETEL